MCDVNCLRAHQMKVTNQSAIYHVSILIYDAICISLFIVHALDVRDHLSQFIQRHHRWNKQYSAAHVAICQASNYSVWANTVVIHPSRMKWPTDRDHAIAPEATRSQGDWEETEWLYYKVIFHSLRMEKLDLKTIIFQWFLAWSLRSLQLNLGVTSSTSYHMVWFASFVNTPHSLVRATIISQPVSWVYVLSVA